MTEPNLKERLAAMRNEPICDEALERIQKLEIALAPFRFLAAPNGFQSDDGGCTEAIICDLDVQAARAAFTEKE